MGPSYMGPDLTGLSTNTIIFALYLLLVLVTLLYIRAVGVAALPHVSFIHSFSKILMTLIKSKTGRRLFSCLHQSVHK